MNQASPSPFPSTSWSLVDRVAQGDESASEPLEHLLSAYWNPLRSHLARKRWFPSSEVDDVIQGFIADKVLEHELIASADQTRGKFRTFLATALDRYAVSEIRRRNAKKRMPAEGVERLEEGMDRVCGLPEPIDMFDTLWAREVVNQALDMLETACKQQRQPQLWFAFESRIVRTSVYGEEPMPYDQLIAEGGFASYGQATKAVFQAKRMYVEHLREVIRRYVTDPEEIDAEIHELRQILARGSGNSQD